MHKFKISKKLLKWNGLKIMTQKLSFWKCWKKTGRTFESWRNLWISEISVSENRVGYGISNSGIALWVSIYWQIDIRWWSCLLWNGKKEDTEHHHRLICKNCRKVSGFKDDLLEELEDTI